MSRIILPVLFCLLGADFIFAADFVWYDAERHRNVPARLYLAAGKEKSPVIVFSHGIGGSIESCSYLAKAWQSHGFACLFVQHPGSDENIWKGKVLILKEFKDCYEQNWNCRTRAEDLRFALDCLETFVAENPRYADRLDLERIGAGGYDLGALTSLLVAGQVPTDYGKSLKDPRIKAVCAMSPPVRAMNISFEKIYQPIDIPALFITGTKDDSIVGPTKAPQRRIPFDSMEGTDRYLITFDGGGHRMYGGRVFSLGAGNDTDFQAAIVRSTALFWLASLKGDQTAVLKMNSRSLNSVVGLPAKIERRPVQRQGEMIAEPAKKVGSKF